jgi:hypothetical protein
VLGVAAGRVGDLSHLDEEGRRGFGGDEVEGLLLPPGVVAFDFFAESLDLVLE